jgi:hypothetical protein
MRQVFNVGIFRKQFWSMSDSIDEKQDFLFMSSRFKKFCWTTASLANFIETKPSEEVVELTDLPIFQASVSVYRKFHQIIERAR